MKRLLWIAGVLITSVSSLILLLALFQTTATPVAAGPLVAPANTELTEAEVIDFGTMPPARPSRPDRYMPVQSQSVSRSTPPDAVRYDPTTGRRPPLALPPPDFVGVWDSERIVAARVISDTGQYRLWYDGLGDFGWGIGMATGPDGVNWTKDTANPVLTPGGPGAWDESYRGQVSMLLDGGVYKMWFSGGVETGVWQTGYATSTNGVNWNLYGANPVLTSGGPGSWNEQEADGPSVIKDGGIYKMWFHGCDAGYGSCAIGYATSPDGVTWTEFGANPVLTATAATWDDGFLILPNVVKTGSSYEMWYTSNGQIGYALSADGINWVKWPTPVIDQAWNGDPAVAPSVMVDGSNYQMWFNSIGMSPDRGVGHATSSDGINWTQNAGNPVLRPGAFLGLNVNYAHDWVDGWTLPSASVAITLFDSVGAVKDTALVTANGDGNFFTDCPTWTSGNCPNIEVDDSVMASAVGLTETIEQIGSITGTLDDVENTVSGVLDAPFWGPTNNPDILDVLCEVWVENGPEGIMTTAAAHTSGNTFICDFDDVGWDLAPGQDVAVRYFEPDGDSVINILGFPWVRANYAHDWVGINYPADHTVWITATDSGGAVKATAMLTTWAGGGWGADGADTDDSHWTPERPDIVPGDEIIFFTDDGYFNLLQVGTINGNLDVAGDAISGTLDVPWLVPVTDTLAVECHPWGAHEDGLNVDDKQSSAPPDGSAPYACDWAGEWDMVPGKDVAVMYLEPDFDRVMNVFRDPAPYLSINKWADSVPAEGGNFVFHLEYWNDGDAPAENVIITDTLMGFTYLSDTNLFSVMTGTIPGGEYVVWDVGTVAAGERGYFDVFVQVTAVASDTVTNVAAIATSNPFDQGEPWEKFSEWEGHVELNDTHLNVGKWAWTGDPAPGYDFVYVVNVCNNGSTASAAVVLTDTLHSSMTVQSWWGQHPGWYEVANTGGQLVLARHTIEAFWCTEVYIEVNLSAGAWPGMYITNTATITASNDLEDGDNFAFWEGEANAPRRNLRVDKYFNWGQLVPGGQIAYGLNVGNDGNVPITSSFLVTDYLPLNTSYNSAWYHDEFGPHPVTPTVVTSDYVVWTVDSLANGYWKSWELIVDIDGDALPGTILTNTFAVSAQPEEDTLDDNESVWVEEVYPPGPNLRLQKYGWWNWEGQLGYWLQVENIGSTTIFSATITDTFPAGTSFNGEWWHNFWQQVDFVDDSGNNQLIWTMDWLEPGWTMGVGFNLDLDGGLIGVQGLEFGNFAHISAPPDEVNPDDNFAAFTSRTGPDVYVEKWLSDGFPAPGEIVTFTVRFGNDNQWPWDTGPESTLTDTLPAAMTFITATAPWDPAQYWTPDILPGNVLVWDWGHVWAEGWWQFDIVVQITDTVEGGDELINYIEMFSDDPGNIEVDYSNNGADAAVIVLAPKFTIDKTHDSSEVAGRPVTYTLTVDNIGTLAGNNLLITDVLPANVTWLSGGTYSAGTGEVSWTVPSLAFDDSINVQFVGQLSCGGPVVNDQYQVAGSDENVASPVGAPVAFTIVAPTIVADFTQSATTIEPGESVTFTSTSTTDGGPLTGWAWDFGDGGSGSGAVVSHTYLLPGTYDVTLTATDGCGYDGMLAGLNAVTVLDFMLYLPVVAKP